MDPSGLRDGLQRRLKQAHWSPLEGTVNKTFSNLFLVYLGHRLDRGTCQKIFGGLYFKRPTGSLAQVWPLTQFFLFPFCKNSLICMEGKSMTPHRGNTFLFSCSQQLLYLKCFIKRSTQKTNSSSTASVKQKQSMLCVTNVVNILSISTCL